MKTLLLFLFALPASAATNLAIVNTDASCLGKPVVNCAGAQVYQVPADNDLVRVSPTDASTWDASFTWDLYKNRAPGQKYEACTSDVTPCTALAADGGPCKSWGFIAKIAPGQAVLTWDAVVGATYNLYQDGVRIAQGLTTSSYAFADPPGVHVFEVSAVVSAVEGARSSKLTYTGPALPAGLHVVALTAYDLVKGSDTLTLKPIGTIALGTPCFASVEALGAYAVPRAKVILQGTSTRPQVVLAQCK